MRLTPHLSFGGRCEAAFKFYERCFGGKIVFMLTYGKSAMAEQVPREWRQKIFHATLTVGDNVLMGADPIPEQYEQPKGFAVMLGIDDPVDAERIFRALAEDGTVQMPLQKTSWSVRFGVLVDQFGIPWAINCEQPPSAA
jgi:PhnB protein